MRSRMHGRSGHRSLLAGLGLLGLLGCGDWYPDQPDSQPVSVEDSARLVREWEAQQLEAQREARAERLLPAGSRAPVDPQG